jgi:hypothetical protein
VVLFPNSQYSYALGNVADLSEFETVNAAPSLPPVALFPNNQYSYALGNVDPEAAVLSSSAEINGSHMTEMVNNPMKAASCLDCVM